MLTTSRSAAWAILASASSFPWALTSTRYSSGVSSQKKVPSSRQAVSSFCTSCQYIMSCSTWERQSSAGRLHTRIIRVWNHGPSRGMFSSLAR